MKMGAVGMSYRGRLFLIVGVLIVGLVGAIAYRVRLSFVHFVRLSEVERIRHAVFPQLRSACKDYLLDRDGDALRGTFDQALAGHPDVAYIFAVDPVDEKRAVLSTFAESTPTGVSSLIGEQASRSEGAWETWAEVGGTEVIDLAERTRTRPPYVLHVGLKVAPVAAKGRGFYFETLLVAGVLAVGAVVIVFAALVMLTHPLERLATAAERLSLGDMTVALPATGRDEVGTLTRALQRMRESLLYAIRRLDRK